MRGFLDKLKKSKTFIVIGIAAASLASLVAGFVIVYYMLAGSAKGAPGVLSRVGNTLAYAVMGAKPHFYYLVGEKNGQEFRLLPGDAFEVTYRDEFVFKEISTDAFGSRRLSLDIEGMGKDNDFRVLLKGIELVDRTIKKGAAAPFNVVVRYDKEVIASLPVKVEITAQDWLRYAKETQNVKNKIAYLEKAIAMNSQDTNVRHMLIALYQKAGMKAEAAAQSRELAALKGGEQKAARLNEPLAAGVKPSVPESVKPSTEKKEPASAKRPAREKKHVAAAGSPAPKGNKGGQIKDAKKASKNDARDDQFYVRLGESYERKGNTREALKAYSRAYQLNPRSQKAGEKIPQLKIKLLKEKYKEEDDG